MLQWSTSPEIVTDEILAELRCDKCYWWDNWPESKTLGDCFISGTATGNGFFCGSWELKSSGLSELPKPSASL